MQNHYLYVAKLPHATWLRYAFPIVIGVGAAGTSMLIDVVRGVENRHLVMSDFFDGIVTALLAFFVVRYYERLRDLSIERLRVAADVNHHIRNALTTVLYSVYVKQDVELIRITQEAVERVDRVLRENLWENDEELSSAGKRLRLKPGARASDFTRTELGHSNPVTNSRREGLR